MTVLIFAHVKQFTLYHGHLYYTLSYLLKLHNSELADCSQPQTPLKLAILGSA